MSSADSQQHRLPHSIENPHPRELGERQVFADKSLYDGQPSVGALGRMKLVVRQQLNTVARFVPLAKLGVDSFDDRVRDPQRLCNERQALSRRGINALRETEASVGLFQQVL